eukprot:1742325-Rhodomonas_salina.4
MAKDTDLDDWLTGEDDGEGEKGRAAEYVHDINVPMHTFWFSAFWCDFCALLTQEVDAGRAQMMFGEGSQMTMATVTYFQRSHRTRSRRGKVLQCDKKRLSEQSTSR